VIEDWNGPVRQRRYFTAAVKRNSQWMSADEAEKVAHVNSKRIMDLVRTERSCRISERFFEAGTHQQYPMLRGTVRGGDCYREAPHSQQLVVRALSQKVEHAAPGSTNTR
jgi:hypothetical protein